MLEHLFSHILGSKIERRADDWVAAGQRFDAAPSLNGAACYLSFGFRYRLRSLLVCLAFGTALFAFCWHHATARQTEYWLVFTYAGFIFPVFLLSAYLALSACTTRVTLSRDGLVVRRFGMDSPLVKWSAISQVYRSSVMPAIVFVANDRRRVRVSTELDGTRALAAYVQHVTPGAVDRSIVDWMIRLP